MNCQNTARHDIHICSVFDIPSWYWKKRSMLNNWYMSFWWKISAYRIESKSLIFFKMLNQIAKFLILSNCKYECIAAHQAPAFFLEDEPIVRAKKKFGRRKMLLWGWLRLILAGHGERKSFLLNDNSHSIENGKPSMSITHPFFHLSPSISFVSKKFCLKSKPCVALHVSLQTRETSRKQISSGNWWCCFTWSESSSKWVRTTTSKFWSLNDGKISQQQLCDSHFQNKLKMLFQGCRINMAKWKWDF